MTALLETKTGQDTALASMVLLLSFLDRPSDEGQLRHLLGKGSEHATADDLVRLARRLDVRARKVSLRRRRLDDMPLPAIAVMRDGTHTVLLQVSAEKALVFDPLRPQAASASIAHAFETEFAGHLGSHDDARAPCRRRPSLRCQLFIPALVR